MGSGINYKIVTIRLGVTVRVKLFSENLRVMDEVSIESVVTIYAHPTTYECFIFRFNEVLIFVGGQHNFVIDTNRTMIHSVIVSHNPS